MSEYFSAENIFLSSLLKLLKFHAIKHCSVLSHYILLNIVAEHYHISHINDKLNVQASTYSDNVTSNNIGHKMMYM